ncbi:helix-turn-helix transcriptional regulator [uncultured Phascolarctobacterium sp.]|nr:helix-turn-helix transcriptional regulator [uncultured Phascolarctobacterium sp.]
MTLCARIRTKRKELNMSQEELTKKLGYKSCSTIAKIESSERQKKQN